MTYCQINLADAKNLSRDFRGKLTNSWIFQILWEQLWKEILGLLMKQYEHT